MKAPGASHPALPCCTPPPGQTYSKTYASFYSGLTKEAGVTYCKQIIGAQCHCAAACSCFDLRERNAPAACRPPQLRAATQACDPPHAACWFASLTPPPRLAHTCADALYLTSTMSNPLLALTVFVPSDKVRSPASGTSCPALCACCPALCTHRAALLRVLPRALHTLLSVCPRCPARACARQLRQPFPCTCAITQ